MLIQIAKHSKTELWENNRSNAHNLSNNDTTTNNNHYYYYVMDEAQQKI